MKCITCTTCDFTIERLIHKTAYNKTIGFNIEILCDFSHKIVMNPDTADRPLSEHIKNM